MIILRVEQSIDCRREYYLVVYNNNLFSKIKFLLAALGILNIFFRTIECRPTDLNSFGSDLTGSFTLPLDNPINCPPNSRPIGEDCYRIEANKYDI